MGTWQAHRPSNVLGLEPSGQTAGACLPDPRPNSNRHAMPAGRSAGSGHHGWQRSRNGDPYSRPWTRSIRGEPGAVTGRRHLRPRCQRHAGGLRGSWRPSRYGWSWPLPPAGSDPLFRPEPSSSCQDRGPAGSWGHERLIGWRCLRALPLGSVREPAWPGRATTTNKTTRR